MLNAECELIAILIPLRFEIWSKWFRCWTTATAIQKNIEAELLNKLHLSQYFVVFFFVVRAHFWNKSQTSQKEYEMKRGMYAACWLIFPLSCCFLVSVGSLLSFSLLVLFSFLLRAQKSTLVSYFVYSFVGAFVHCYLSCDADYYLFGFSFLRLLVALCWYKTFIQFLRMVQLRRMLLLLLLLPLQNMNNGWVVVSLRVHCMNYIMKTNFKRNLWC